MISVVKWFALSALFFNLAYFAWFLSVGNERQSVGAQDLPMAANSITLLADLSPEQLASLKSSAKGSVQGNDSEEPGDLLLASEPYCPSVGPFSTLDQVKNLGGQLAKSGLSAKARKVLVDSSEKYRVFLKAHGSYEEASQVLQELRAKKIDSYIMTDAAHANAISLGIFSTRDSAEGLARKMSSYGYQTQIEATRLDKEEYWLDIQYSAEAEKTDAILMKVMASTEGLTRIDAPCKVVALVE